MSFQYKFTVRAAAVLLGVIVSSANLSAELITSISLTGEQLLTDPNTVFPNANRVPVNNFNGTITFNAGVVANEILSRITLVAPGVIAPSTTTTVSMSATAIPLTGDNDFTLMLSDGTNAVGFERGDNGGGKFFLQGGTDAISVISPGFGSGDNSVSFNNSFTVDFTLDSTTTFQATMGGGGGSSTLRIAPTPLDPTQGLVLLLVGDSNGERYQVNNISAQVDGTTANTTVPEPTSLAIWSLLAVAGAGYGWRRGNRTHAA